MRNWQAGDTIPLGADRMLRVVETQFLDDEPVLVVEDVESLWARAVQGRSGLGCVVDRND